MAARDHTSPVVAARRPGVRRYPPWHPALVAQGIEHRFPEPCVACSNHAEGATRTCRHATIERVWRDRFSNASDWVFAISGDFDIDEATDLARRYIGTLSGTGATENFKDFQIDPPSTVISKEVHAGAGEKGSLSLEWNADYAATVGESVYADLLTSVLNTRLTDHIREELGASYSPSAIVSILKEPDHLVQSYLNVTGDPSADARHCG